jgi:hypothetical protein
MTSRLRGYRRGGHQADSPRVMNTEASDAGKTAAPMSGGGETSNLASPDAGAAPAVMPIGDACEAATLLEGSTISGHASST